MNRGIWDKTLGNGVENMSVHMERIDDYICITDIAAAKSDDSRAADVVRYWLRNRRTLEFYTKRIRVGGMDAIKNYIIPNCNYRDDLQWLPYAEEADLLNVALFGFTAKA